MLKPLAAGRWTEEEAAHLLSRAGFGGPPQEVERLARLHPDEAVASLLDYENIPEAWPAPAWARPDPERLKKLREVHRFGTPVEKKAAEKAERKLQRERLVELRSWWLNRMVKGRRPLQEKLVLFWHGHFATSVVKVRDAYYMWRQNELFRRLATGNWLELLTQAGKDPAMLIWLDQATSRRPHANENFAREVMELFALGEGHYTETEMTAAARALTGWSLDRLNQCYVYRPRFHDNGRKTFFGHSGNLDGDDVIRIIVAQPQAARFITGKLWKYFTGQEPAPALNDALAAVFRENGNNFKPVLRVLFRSEEFYDPAIIRNAVKSPVEWMVGSARRLECDLPPAKLTEGILRRLGQDLFAPPNVKGWDGGLAWITTNTLLDRYNTAALFVQGAFEPGQHSPGRRNRHETSGAESRPRARRVHVGGVRVDKILPLAERADANRLVAALAQRLLQSPLQADQEKALRGFLSARPRLTDQVILAAVRLVMCTPEYQVT